MICVYAICNCQCISYLVIDTYIFYSIVFSLSWREREREFSGTSNSSSNIIYRGCRIWFWHHTKTQWAKIFQKLEFHEHSWTFLKKKYWMKPLWNEGFFFKKSLIFLLSVLHYLYIFNPQICKTIILLKLQYSFYLLLVGHLINNLFN